jgi:hypothetical protein
VRLTASEAVSCKISQPTTETQGPVGQISARCSACCLQKARMGAARLCAGGRQRTHGWKRSVASRKMVAITGSVASTEAARDRSR